MLLYKSKGAGCEVGFFRMRADVRLLAEPMCVL